MLMCVFLYMMDLDGMLCNSRTNSCLDDEDILLQVLYRLPSKCLFKFKSVSKTWHRLLSEPAFLHRYLSSNSPSPLVGFIFQSISPFPSSQFRCFLSYNQKTEIEPANIINASLDFIPESVCIDASCNGILLCSLNRFHGKKYYVCNPITHAWISIPKPPTSSNNAAIGFVCEEGHTPNSLLYKVVQARVLAEFSELEAVTIEIYSSDTGKWLKSYCTGTQAFQFVPSKGPAVVRNGVFHWIGTKRQIVTYDMNDHTIELKKLPEIHPALKILDKCLGLSNGCLHYGEIRGISLDIWALEDHCNVEWCLKYRASLITLAKRFTHSLKFVTYCFFGISAFHVFNPDIVFISLEERIIVYNIKTQTADAVLYVAGGIHRNPDHTLFPYVLPKWSYRLV